MPEWRASCGRLNVHGLPLEEDFPLVGLLSTGEAFDERRLAGTVVADDGEHFAGEQLEAGRRQAPRRGRMF